MRKTPNIIQAYMEMTEQAPAPANFRLWSAITMVAGSMSRRCWVESKNGLIYPNMMNVLVGPPSVGKGPAIAPAKRLLETIDYSDSETRSKDGIRLGPDDTTAPGLFDELCDPSSIKTFRIGSKVTAFSSTLIIAEELAALFHTMDLRFMATLVKLLNCDNLSQRLRKTGERVSVPAPSLTILGGVQPKVLHEIFPESAWGMGLTARAIFIFSKEGCKADVFDLDNLGSREDKDKVSYEHPLFKSIAHDMAEVAKLTGKIVFEKAAAARINEWWRPGSEAEETAPKHPRLRDNYAGKRIQHVVRLAMVHNVARTNDMVASAEDVEMAITALYSAEQTMGQIFTTMGAVGSNKAAIEDIAHQVEDLVALTHRPVPHHIMLDLISDKVPAYNVQHVFGLLVDQNLLKEVKLKERLSGAGGRKAYIPFTAILDDL